MRIVSLLPSASEIVCALGLRDSLVGVTHACDYPPGLDSTAVVTRPRLALAGRTSAEIDAAVAASRAAGETTYELDLELLASLAPDLLLTQGLCEVCAVSHGLVSQALPSLPGRPTVLTLSPQHLADVLSDIKTVGDFSGRQLPARELIAALRARLDRVALATAKVARSRRVACLEWLDPPWTAGHWVPEMVGLAGGVELLATPGLPSRRTSWAELTTAQPELIVLMPCGFDLPRTLAEVKRTSWPRDWFELEAVQLGQVWAVDGSAYFNRPGPRLFDGLELLASLFWPARFGPPQEAAARLEAACYSRAL